MAEYPISPDLMQAFRTAIQAVRDWNRYGGVEPLVNYQGLPYPVSDLEHFQNEAPYPAARR
jgi:hypothetical protein